MNRLKFVTKVRELGGEWLKIRGEMFLDLVISMKQVQSPIRPVRTF